MLICLAGKENSKPDGNTVIMGILLVEPAIVPDVYISGVFGPEDIGNGNMRFTGYARQEVFDRGGVQYVIVNRLIIPVPVIMQSIKDTMKALGMNCTGRSKQGH